MGLGASWASALEASPFKSRKGGPRAMSALRKSCETGMDSVKVLWRLLNSFCLSWDTFGLHFRPLESSWDAILAQLGPSWPKMPKKTSIFGFDFRSWHQVGSPKSRKIDVKNDVFFRCISDIDFYGFFIDFGLRKST